MYTLLKVLDEDDVLIDNGIKVVVLTFHQYKYRLLVSPESESRQCPSFSSLERSGKSGIRDLPCCEDLSQVTTVT